MKVCGDKEELLQGGRIGLSSFMERQGDEFVCKDEETSSSERSDVEEEDGGGTDVP